MGNLESFLTTIENHDKEILLEQLETAVKVYEKFGETIVSQPTERELDMNFKYKCDFKDLYKTIIKKTPINARAEALLTRFKRVELHIDKLKSPSAYN